MKLKLSLIALAMINFYQLCGAANDQKSSAADASIFFTEPLKISRRSTYPDERTLREKRVALHITKPRGRKPDASGVPTSLAARRSRMSPALMGDATMIQARQAYYLAIITHAAAMQNKPTPEISDQKKASLAQSADAPKLNPPLDQNHRNKFDRSFAKAMRVANGETLPRRFTAGDAHPPSEKN